LRLICVSSGGHAICDYRFTVTECSIDGLVVAIILYEQYGQPVLCRCMCVCVVVEMSNGNDSVQLLDNSQLHVDLHRGTLPAHAAVRRRLLGEQRRPLVHRLRLELVIIASRSHTNNDYHRRANDNKNKEKNKKLRYRRDSARCVKRPFTVTQGHPLLCQSTRHI